MDSLGKVEEKLAEKVVGKLEEVGSAEACRVAAAKVPPAYTLYNYFHNSILYDRQKRVKSASLTHQALLARHRLRCITAKF